MQQKNIFFEIFFGGQVGFNMVVFGKNQENCMTRKIRRRRMNKDVAVTIEPEDNYRLSLKAQMIHRHATKLQQKNGTSIVKVDDLMDLTCTGARAIYSGIEELRKNGYVRKVRFTNIEGNFVRNGFWFTKQPYPKSMRDAIDVIRGVHAGKKSNRRSK
jgi:hypothetical protein